jgi:hypothetical protein
MIRKQSADPSFPEPLAAKSIGSFFREDPSGCGQIYVWQGVNSWALITACFRV